MPLLIDRLSLQPSLRPLSVLVYFLFLTHICKASDVISCPVISLLGNGKMGVDLNCKSKGWQAEAQVIWMDTAGNLLSAGPTETVRGPDDLYTVSSRVTVEKTHSNSFTCRVQQNTTNQIREAKIYIADDFFEVQSSSSSTTAGLAASLAVSILFNLILGFFVWKYKTKRSHRDKSIERENEKRSQSYRSEYRVVPGEETETQQLETQENVQMEVLNEEDQQLSREAAEKSRRFLEKELETKKTEIRKKQSDLQQLDEEKKKKEENVKRLKEQLENKNTEVKELEAAIAKHSWFSSTSKKEEQQKKKEDAEKEVENLKKQLETDVLELDTKTKQFKDKQAEIKKLEEEIQETKTDIQNLTEKLRSNNFERSGAAPDQPSSSSVEGNVN